MDAGMIAVGAGIIVIGGGIGIGLLWMGGLSAMSRQPEIQNRLLTAMLVGAGLIEALALFGLVLCLWMVLK